MSSSIEFNTDYHCPIGEIEPVAPGLRRITANNPGPLTFRGTGTYIVGEGEVALIDPGPKDPAHTQAILSALGDERITHILVTHTHKDHSAGTALLQEHCKAPSYALGPHGAYQRASELPEDLDDAGDLDFTPNEILKDGDAISGSNWSLQCLHTPGHASNHAAFAEEEHQRLFVGDLVMGWSTPVLLPPDGHLGAYLESLETLLTRQDRIYWPTHGGSIDNPKALVRHLIEHRLTRVKSVLDAIKRGHASLESIVIDAYPGLDQALFPAAVRSVLASVVYLIENDSVAGDLSQGLKVQLSAR